MVPLPPADDRRGAALRDGREPPRLPVQGRGRAFALERAAGHVERGGRGPRLHARPAGQRPLAQPARQVQRRSERAHQHGQERGDPPAAAEGEHHARPSTPAAGAGDAFGAGSGGALLPRAEKDGCRHRSKEGRPVGRGCRKTLRPPAPPSIVAVGARDVERARCPRSNPALPHRRLRLPLTGDRPLRRHRGGENGGRR